MGRESECFMDVIYVWLLSNLNYSIYATFTISAAIELQADLLAIWGLNWLGRRASAFVSLTLSGLCMVICGLYLGKNLKPTSNLKVQEHQSNLVCKWQQKKLPGDQLLACL